VMLAITPLSEDYGKDEALKAGCDACIVKPINTRTLLRQIENAVAAKAKISLSKIHP
jgi:AmiR/NasT family two-component response regulator